MQVVRRPVTVIRGRERGTRKGDIRRWVRSQPEPGQQRTRRIPEPGSRTVHHDLDCPFLRLASDLTVTRL